MGSCVSVTFLRLDPVLAVILSNSMFHPLTTLTTNLLLRQGRNSKDLLCPAVSGEKEEEEEAMASNSLILRTKVCSV